MKNKIDEKINYFLYGYKGRFSILIEILMLLIITFFMLIKSLFQFLLTTNYKKTELYKNLKTLKKFIKKENSNLRK